MLGDRRSPRFGAQRSVAIGRLLGEWGAMVRVALLLAVVPTAAIGAETVWLPEGRLYPEYVADVRRSASSASYLAVEETDLPDSGDRIFLLSLGGRFPLLRRQPAGEAERGFQLEVEAGFRGEFDITESYDNVGWDGVYGLIATWRPRPRLALLLGVHHVSAHIGDEYAERTGRERLGYTREEARAGVAWRTRPGLWLYAEGAWGYDLRQEDLQEPGRAQLGLAWDSAGEASGWGRFAALDAQAFEERDWESALSVTAGVRFRRAERVWRLGLHLYDGPAPLGELFLHDQRWAGVRLGVDL